MRLMAIIAFIILSGPVAANAQSPKPPPALTTSPLTPTELPSVKPPITTTTLPVNPINVDVRITELIVTTGGKPFVLPVLPAAGSPRDDEKTAKQAALRNKYRILENTVGEADAPDGGTGSSSSTEITPAGFVIFPDGHPGYNATALEQTSALSITPKVQKDKTIHVELYEAFTQITHPVKPSIAPAKPKANSAAPVKPKTDDFHPPVIVTLTARAGETLFIGPPDIGHTTVRLIFATITILPSTKE